MHPHQIAAQVDSLPLSSAPDHFPLAPLAESLFLSRSLTGEPCLVLTYAPAMRLPSGRRTEGLLLTFHEAFSVTLEGESTTSRGAVLRCLSPDLHYYFYVMVSGLLNKVAEHPGSMATPSALLSYVEEWQGLLLNRRGFTPEEEIGLWGELHLLLACPDLDGAVAAWKGPKRKTHDFSANQVDIDVKTSLQGHQHHFRLEQLRPSPSGGQRLICSIRVVEDPAGGTTIDDLVARVRERILDPGPFEKLLLVGRYTTGVPRALQLSALEMLLVRAEDAPAVVPAPGVSRVEFVSDLRSCPHLSPEQTVLVLDQLTTKAGS